MSDAPKAALNAENARLRERALRAFRVATSSWGSARMEREFLKALEAESFAYDAAKLTKENARLREALWEIADDRISPYHTKLARRALEADHE